MQLRKQHRIQCLQQERRILNQPTQVLRDADLQNNEKKTIGMADQ